MPPKVDLKKCQGAGKCIEVCPTNVFEMKGKKVSIPRPNDCIECRACEVACPNSAIYFE